MAVASFCRLFLLALVFAQVAVFASASSLHHRHHHHVAAPADDSTVLTSSVVASQENDEADKDVEDVEDADDDSDEDDSETAKLNITIPTAVQPSQPDAAVRSSPASGDMLESSYAVDKNEAFQAIYTPQGRLTKARQQLQDNLMRQAKIAAAIADMQNETGFQQKVDTESTAVASETQASSLATMLGGMRKEMRQFAAPFYLDNLNSERQKLKTAEVGLQADLAAAEQALGLGHQGWPELGQKVVVAESTFRRPVAFLGSA